MAPAFSWFLALRYLVTRWVNLIGMMGIALAVWAMIVVVAVFSGFIGDTKRGIQDCGPKGGRRPPLRQRRGGRPHQ